MLDLFRSLIRKIETPEPHFGDDDARLAVAALLVHCSGIDGSVSLAERVTLRELLQRAFGLPQEQLDLLIADAIAAEQDAVDLYRFTSVLKRQMSEAERIRVVESLWELVYADGVSHEFEENLVWRVAELLGVSSRDRIATKRAATERKPKPE